MAFSELTGFTNEDWCRVVRVFQHLLAPSEGSALARALVDALAREFELGSVQVWFRAGETNLAGLALTHLAEELELAAHRQDPARVATPLHLGVFDSLSGFVATEGVPYRWCAKLTPPMEWEDVQWAQKAGYGVGLAVPLVVHGRAVGTLTIWETGEGKTFPEGAALLIAEHASLALTQIRRLHKMKRQVQWLTGLQQVTGLLASRLSLEDLYRLIFEEVSRILSISGFSINLYDESSGLLERTLIVETESGRYSFRPREPWRAIEGTVWERVVHTREPILINRSVANASPASRMGEPQEGARPVASVMYAPMLLGDQVIGVMSAHSHTPAAYDQETLDLLSTVANQAALAIENARLVDRLSRQIQETQMANQLKSQFVANISHEVRTPLNSIIGFTRIVKRRAASLLPEQHLKNLDYVLESADHLLRLINDLLDLSRLEAGRLQLVSETVDVRRLIVQTVCELEPLMEQSGNEIVFEPDESLGSVVTDSTRVRQVLVNLVSNAFKFARGSRITIRTGRPKSLTPEEKGWHVSKHLGSPPESSDAPEGQAGKAGGSTPPLDRYFFVEVADAGPGIGPDTLAKVFEEFRQASSGDGRLHPGTGLGLSIVQRIAERMEGGVWARSTPGEGSVFRAILAELAQDRPPTPDPERDPIIELGGNKTPQPIM